jgi:hypothetical protein
MHVRDADLVPTLNEQTEGDALSAAVYARVHTKASFTHWLGPLGNYLIARPAARRSAQGTSQQTDVPLDAAVVLGLGERALHVWSADPMLSDVSDHLGTVPLGRISTISTEPAASWAPLTLTLEDGHTIELEARGDASGFARAFDERAGASAA